MSYILFIELTKTTVKKLVSSSLMGVYNKHTLQYIYPTFVEDGCYNNNLGLTLHWLYLCKCLQGHKSYSGASYFENVLI